MITRVAIFILVSIAFTAPGLAAQSGDLSRTSPHPSLKPLDVVRIVMNALQRNDAGGANNGIAITYKFASPANRRMTGPLPDLSRWSVGPCMGR